MERAQAAERKKAWVQSTFADGKSMVESGRTREALLLWGTLTPYLSKEPEMKTYIKKVRCPKIGGQTYHQEARYQEMN